VAELAHRHDRRVIEEGLNLRFPEKACHRVGTRVDRAHPLDRCVVADSRVFRE